MQNTYPVNPGLWVDSTETPMETLQDSIISLARLCQLNGATNTHKQMKPTKHTMKEQKLKRKTKTSSQSCV